MRTRAASLVPLVRMPRRAAQSGAWLAAVAAAYSLAQLLFVPPRLGLGWDETIYVSQVSRGIPASSFSAPRARGISVLVAPIASLTTSTVALRVYLSVASGLGLLAALWAWRRLRPAWVLAIAGIAFAGLWVTQFYGPQAMPNLWVAFGGLAAVGCFLRVALARPGEPGRRAALAGLVVSLAAAALVRPSDAIWLALPMVVAALAGGAVAGVPARPAGAAWPRWPLLAAVVGGLLAGSAEWIAEAYARFGGPLARLHLSSLAEGQFGLHFALPDELRALNGPTLCRPCTVAWKYPVLSAWWLALPLIVAFGVAASARAARAFAHGANGANGATGAHGATSAGGTDRAAGTRTAGGAAARAATARVSSLLPALCGLSVALPYVFLIDYAAPRFLLPTYALLAIPAADAVARLVTPAAADLRPIMITVVAFALAVQLTAQHLVLDRTVGRTTVDHTEYTRVVADLRALGIRPPCLLTGDQAIPIAFYAGCASAQISGTDKDTTAAGILAAAATTRTAVLVRPGTKPPSYAAGWRVAALPGTRALRLAAYLAPR